MRTGELLLFKVLLPPTLLSEHSFPVCHPLSQRSIMSGLVLDTSQCGVQLYGGKYLWVSNSSAVAATVRKRGAEQHLCMSPPCCTVMQGVSSSLLACVNDWARQP